MLSFRLIEASWKMLISSEVVEKKSEELRRLEIVKCKVLLFKKSERCLDEEVPALRFGYAVGLSNLQSIEATRSFSAHVNKLRTGFGEDIATGTENPQAQIVMLKE
jgi:hypothetical protein